MSPLLDIAEAAVQLNVKERFVRRLVFEKRIGYIKVGRYIRFEQKHIEHFKAENEESPAPRYQSPLLQAVPRPEASEGAGR